MVKRSWPPPPSLATQVRQLSLSDPLAKLIAQSASVIFLGILAFGVLLSFSFGLPSQHQGRYFIWFLLGGGFVSFLVYRFGRNFGRKKRTFAFDQSFRPIFGFLESKGRSSFARSSANVIRLIPRFQAQSPQNMQQLVPLCEAFDFLLLLLMQTISLGDNLGSAAAKAANGVGQQKPHGPQASDSREENAAQALEESLLEIQRLFIYYDAGILQRDSATQIGRRALSSQIAAAEFKARALEQALLLERQLVTGMQEIDRFLRDTVGQNDQAIEKRAADFFVQWSVFKQKIINDFGGFLTSSGHSS